MYMNIDNQISRLAKKLPADGVQQMAAALVAVTGERSGGNPFAAVNAGANDPEDDEDLS